MNSSQVFVLSLQFLMSYFWLLFMIFRWVYSVTDYMWCEVWINSLDRWIHCDPYEALCDSPSSFERVSLAVSFGYLDDCFMLNMECSV